MGGTEVVLCAVTVHTWMGTGARIPDLYSTGRLIGVPSASQKCDVADRKCPHHQHGYIFCYVAKGDPQM